MRLLAIPWGHSGTDRTPEAPAALGKQRIGERDSWERISKAAYCAAAAVVPGLLVAASAAGVAEFNIPSWSALAAASQALSPGRWLWAGACGAAAAWMGTQVVAPSRPVSPGAPPWVRREAQRREQASADYTYFLIIVLSSQFLAHHLHHEGVALLSRATPQRESIAAHGQQLMDTARYFAHVPGVMMGFAFVKTLVDYKSLCFHKRLAPARVGFRQRTPPRCP